MDEASTTASPGDEQTSRPGTPVVLARGLGRSFDEVIALQQVDLDLPAGQVHGIVGPNGAGKSTLLGMLLGLSAPDAGELVVLGTRVTRGLALPEGVAGFVDAPGLYPALSARANLRQLARLHRLDDADERVRAVLDELGLTDVADDRVRGFSLGMRQRLGLAAALLTNPRLLVLDEPSNGLDPAGRAQVHRVIRRLAAEGVTVVLSSHRMDDLSQLCDVVTLLGRGRVVFTGTVDELARRGTPSDHRLVTTDPRGSERLAATVPGLLVERRPGSAELVLHGALSALDELVRRLVAEGIAVRELAPLVDPLEAAFLRLTDAEVQQ